MKAFNRLSAGLCLSVFLFCPVHGVWGQGAGESSWQLKGLVDTYHAFRSEKPNDWMSSRTRLRGEVGKNFAGSSLFVSFNATYNALLKERTGFELREAYLDHRQEHWGFRLGRQLVIWGAADGVRITDLVSPMDMTEFLAQDYDDIRMPVIEYKPSGSQLTVSPRYYRMGFVGGDVSKPLGQFVLRGEAAFNLGKHFSYIQQAASTPQKGFNTINWLVGADWYAPHEWTVMAQFSSESIFKYESYVAQPRHNSLLTLCVSKKLLDSNLQLSDFTYFDLNHKGIVSRFTADYALNDHIHLLAGYDWFGGSEGMFGPYKHNSEVWAKAKYCF